MASGKGLIPFLTSTSYCVCGVFPTSEVAQRHHLEDSVSPPVTTSHTLTLIIPPTADKVRTRNEMQP